MNYERLSKNPIMRGIEKNEIEHLLKCLHAFNKSYKKEEWILQRGQTTHHIGVLLNGKALIIKDDYWGNRSIISELQAGDLFAESYACIAGKELEVSLLAAMDCEVLFLDIEYITKTCKNACQFHHRIIQNLLMIASQKNLFLTQKMEHITKRTTREKILSYLSSQSFEKTMKCISIPFDRQQFADYLSVDRSALSYELSRMQKDGLIKYHKNVFELL